jgi:hypothetical protein
MSQGPGWWIASNDKWYPPESHPDAVAAREAAAAEAKKAAEPKKAEPKKEDAAPPEPVVSSPASSRPSTPSVVPPLPTDPRPGPAASMAAGRSPWPWVLGVVVILGLAVAALVVALASGSSSGSGSPASVGTSSGPTIDITVPGSGRPGFSGAVGGKNLTGTVVDGTVPAVGADPGTLALQAPVFTYKGDFGGAPYVLHVSLDEKEPTGQLQNDQFVFYVTGTYASEPVTASATFNLTSVSGTSQKVSFSGHVGSQPITGVVTVTMQAAGRVTITGNVNAVPTA